MIDPLARAPIEGIRPGGLRGGSEFSASFAAAGTQAVTAATEQAYFGVVRLMSWPHLTALPAETVPLAARLCALVDRKPTTASLIPLILNAPRDAVFTTLDTLRAAGHLHWTAAPGAPGTALAAAPAPETLPEESAPAQGSLVGKLWGWLSGRKP